MSLFDVLRYPISDIPTEDELVALPDDIFHYWTTISFNIIKNRGSAIIYLRSQNTDKVTPKVDKLRKIIKEWDESL